MENSNQNPFLKQINTEENTINNTSSSSQDNKQIIPKKKVSILMILFWIFFLILFLSVLLIFVLVIWWPNSPLLVLLWIEALSIQQSLLSLTNTIFLVFSLILFIILSIWVFRWLLSKKEDTEKRKFSLFLSIFSWISLFITMIIWIWLYNFIAKFDFQLNIKAELQISPKNTENLIAPAIIDFSINDAILIAQNKWKRITKILWDFDNDWSFEKQWLESDTSYEVKNSWMNKTIVMLEFQDWTTQVFEKLFYLWQATFYAMPEKWASPLNVNFDASNLSISWWNKIVEYRWYFNWENESFNTTKTPVTQFVFEKIWTYKVLLVTLDSANTIKKYYKEIIVKTPEISEKILVPIIQISPSKEGNAPFKIVLDASQSTSKKNEITKYEWKFSDSQEITYWKTISKVFDSPWEYEIYLNIEDKEWNKDSITDKIKVLTADNKPNAIINTNPSLLTWSIPFSVEFDASSSIDINNDIVDYAWDFDGDWNFDIKWAKTSYTFMNPWNQIIRLTVTDSKWNIWIKDISFYLEDRTNKAILNVDKNSWSIPLIVSFDASSTQVWIDDSIVNFEWDFWDSTNPEFWWAKVKHKFTIPWNYLVKLKAYSEKWKILESSKQIFVREPQLQACFSASKTIIKAPSDIKFDSLCSQWEILEWTWDFWDWSLSKSPSPIHRFTSPWNYKVILQITNEKKNVSEYEQLIEVK